MGDNALAHAIRRAARAMRRAAGDLRKGAAPGGDTAPLAAIFRLCPSLDADDFELLAELVTGQLGRDSGDRRASYSRWTKQEAEAAVRRWRAKNGGTLKAACKAVLAADRKKVERQFPNLHDTSLFNYVRRSKRAK